MKLNHHIKHIKGVGETMVKTLSKFNITTYKDLLLFLPFRYDDFSKTKRIGELIEGEQVTISVVVEHIANKRSPRKRMYITEAIVSDGEDRMRLVWFSQPYIAKTLKDGDNIFVSGKVIGGDFGVSMNSPQYEKIKLEAPTSSNAKIIPVYPGTSGLSQKKIRGHIKDVLSLAQELPDFLPQDIKDKAGVISYGEAIKKLHAPDNVDQLNQALNRMKFDEIFLMQLRAEKIRQSLSHGKANVINFDKDLATKFTQKLPFELTKDQKISSWEILQDIEKSAPMNRLLEGDVGSGKTVVAAMVAHHVADKKMQTVIMAPTEILASQHYKSLKKLLKQDLNLAILTRTISETSDDSLQKTSVAGRKKVLKEKISLGEVDVVIGTHALLTDDTTFKNLAFVVIDEQHRFGVEQRKKLRQKSGTEDIFPHFLSMTATPIPRSFALVIYGDLDLSIIKTMPLGRKPVITQLIQPNMRNTSYQFIREQIKEGRQAFVICSLVDLDKAKNTDKKAVLQEYEKLKTEIFPDLNVGFVHGKLKAKEKAQAMQDFADKKLDILVSTSVIEVGVDIPNATVMIIEDADRFGLAQLHQFRGRVGRSAHQSYCFLFTDSNSQQVKDRLNFFQNNTDGFAVAEYDLQQRGPGEVYGKAQSGDMNFRFASLSDHELIIQVQNIVKNIPFEDYPTLQEYIYEYEKDVHLE